MAMTPSAMLGTNAVGAVFCMLLKKLLVSNRWPRLLPWLLTVLAVDIAFGPYFLGAGLFGISLAAILWTPKR